jgi:retron-type reverse transcriptase
MRAERRGRAVRGCVRPVSQKFSGRSRASELKLPGKPFEISRRAVWEAWEKVRANKGAPGANGESVADFEKDLKGNLYKIWNRMSSGTYLPPPVRAVEVAKAHGTGTRILGVPTVADRIAQTVVAGVLEERAERLFHPDSCGYRPKRSALDAVAACGGGAGRRTG